MGSKKTGSNIVEGNEAAHEATDKSQRHAERVRPHDLRRGNDLLYKPRGEADRFDHYLGPMGGDVRMSIEGPSVNNLDDAGGDQVYNKRSQGHLGLTRTRSTRNDESDY